MTDQYWQKHYRSTSIIGVDELTVEKSRGTDWLNIAMTINEPGTTITIRSKEQLEQLRFMLGQVLDVKS